MNPRLVGLVVRGVEIRGIEDLEQFIKDNEVQIAALTIPKSKAPEIADRLVKAGIKAIWNFAHTDLQVPDDVVVEKCPSVGEPDAPFLPRMQYAGSESERRSAEKAGRGSWCWRNKMIVGIGTDLVEIERIEKSLWKKRHFLVRVYTEEERRQAGGNASRLAGDFAVKEAVSKVFGTGFRGFGLLDIEVLRDEFGKTVGAASPGERRNLRTA